MKKVLAVAAIAAFSLGFTSCKKDYVCECSITILGTTSTTSVDHKGLSKKDAETVETACTSSSLCTWKEA